MGEKSSLTVNAGAQLDTPKGSSEDQFGHQGLEDSQHQLIQAIEQTDDVIFMTQIDGTITYVNPAFEKVYGFTRDEALGRTPRMLKSGRMSQGYYEQLWKTLLAGETHRGEHVNKTKNGRLLTVAATVSPIYDLAGKINGFMAVQKDVTERKKAKKVAEALYSTMDPQVAELIVEKQLQTDKRMISVLFSDLKDFTKFSRERRPEIVVSELNRLLEEMEAVLSSYHGHIDKHLGDGIMVEFGAPVHYDQHAPMAAIAGLKMQEQMAKGDFPWQMRIGIATGEPIIGLIGHRRLTYTAIGDTVNLASRIQTMCTPGAVTLDGPTYSRAKRFVEARKKNAFPFGECTDPEFVETVKHDLSLVEEHPEDVQLLKKVGLRFFKGRCFLSAHNHLSRALELDLEDDEVKIAYAEASLELKKMEKGSVSGQAVGLDLYELVGLKNPLLDRQRIPNKLYDKYHHEVEKATEYPEEIILPVEVVDGSIGHSRLVGFLSFALADALDLGSEEKTSILRAGYLADVGKSTVPHHLLNRAGGLTKKEFDEIARHAQESVKILREWGYQDEAVFEIIESSHESFLGSGYPVGLSREEIPLGARIVAVADSYAGMTSWRPYRNEWDQQGALAEMLRDTRKGKFDPQIMEIFEKLLQASSPEPVSVSAAHESASPSRLH